MTAPLLYELYQEIRCDKQLDKPGLEEYYLLIKLIHSGHLIKSFDDLAFAIETMWLKSQAQQQRFRQVMEKRKTVLIEILRQLQTEAATGEGNVTQSAPSPDKVKLADNDLTKSPTALTGATGLEEAAATTTTTPVTILKEEDTLPPPPQTDIGNASFSFGATGNGVTGTLQFDTENAQPKALTEIPYLFTNDYFPVNNRHLQQAWRMLKDKSQAGEARDIDVEATITETARQGYFSALQYEKIIVNQLKLFIFIDRSSSMVAEEAFGRELCNTAIQSELHKDLQPLYFTEVPEKDTFFDDYVLVSEDWTDSCRLKKMFSAFNKKNIVVIIYSDAGALNNSYNEERARKTIDFIDYLHQYTAYASWINPAPKNRWTGTTAGIVSGQIPMFETERVAVTTAISVLKGKFSITAKTNADAS